MKPLDLLIVGVNWPPETFIQRKLQGLASRGVKVTVATATPRGRARQEVPGVNLVRLSHPEDPAPWQLAKLVRDLTRLRCSQAGRWAAMKTATRSLPAGSARTRFARLRSFAPLAALRPQVVHFEWNGAAVDYLPLYSVWNCPVVVSCRGSQINIRPHLSEASGLTDGYRTTFERAAAVHCVSQTICQEAQGYGLDPKKAWVIRPAVDPELFKPGSNQARNGGPFRVVTTGPLLWRKVNEYCLSTLRSLNDSGIPATLDVIGDGPERQRILYTIHDLGLVGKVVLHGKLATDQVKARLQQADAFVLTSLSEGISNAVLEAMACGLPVVTTDCGGMREAVSDGVEGWVIPVRDPPAMTQALARLARDAGLRQRMGEAARARIVNQFSLPAQIDEWLRLYRSVCGVAGEAP